MAKTRNRRTKNEEDDDLVKRKSKKCDTVGKKFCCFIPFVFVKYFQFFNF